jgi:MFS family permease
MILTTLADVVPETQRTNFFYNTGAAGLVAQFIAPTITAVVLPRYSTPVVFLIGLAVYSVTFPLIFCLPESAPAVKSPVLPETSGDDIADSPAEDNADNNNHKQAHGVVQSIKARWHETTRGIAELLSHGGLVKAAVFADFVSSFGINIKIILLQYMTRRFGWSHGQVRFSRMSKNTYINFKLSHSPNHSRPP